MKKLTTINFQLIQNLIVLKCAINGENRTFIFDSGAPRVILNSRYQEITQNEKYKGRTIQGATGAISDVRLTKIEHLRCGHVEKRNIEPLVMDLSQLEEAIQDKVYGLIGYDFFCEYAIYLDYHNLRLGFWNDGDCKEFLSTNPHRLYHFRIEKYLPIIECRVGMTSCTLALDTGANTNLVDLELHSSLKESMNLVDDHSNIIGANVDTTLSSHPSGTMKNLEIEGLGHFSDMNTVYANVSHLNHNTAIKIQGVLGYQFLSQQQIIIDFINHKLYLFNTDKNHRF